MGNKRSDWMGKPTEESPVGKKWTVDQVASDAFLLKSNLGAKKHNETRACKPCPSARGRDAT